MSIAPVCPYWSPIVPSEVDLKSLDNGKDLPNNAKDKITANVARVDLTPPLEMKFALGGYGDRMNKPAIGVHDKIWAKAQ